MKKSVYKYLQIIYIFYNEFVDNHQIVAHLFFLNHNEEKNFYIENIYIKCNLLLFEYYLDINSVYL
jgi:hypothetical protein